MKHLQDFPPKTLFLIITTYLHSTHTKTTRTFRHHHQIELLYMFVAFGVCTQLNVVLFVNIFIIIATRCAKKQTYNLL